MQKLLSALILAAAFAVHASADTNRPAIPPGVDYKFIDDKLDASIRTSLAATFLQGESATSGLFEEECTCAPGYWRILSGTVDLKSAIVTAFTIPNRKTGKTYNLDGAKIKEPGDLKLLARHFASDIGRKPIIRRLTTDEIAKFWVVVPFAIEEPTYLLENGSRHFVICLRKKASASEYNIWWIDSLTEYDYS